MDRHEFRLWRHGRREVQFGGSTPTLLAWRVMSTLALCAFLLQMIAGMMHFVARPDILPQASDTAPYRGDVPPAAPVQDHGRHAPLGR